MRKSTIFTSTKIEKIKPNPVLQRRNSTGGAAAIFSQPNPIPNYLRASIGSCHDLCKYGTTRDSPPGESGKNINMRPEAKSNVSTRVKKVPETKNIVPASSRRKPNEVSKTTCNARAVKNDHEVKKRSSLPRPTSSSSAHQESSVRIPVSKIRRSHSVPRKVLKAEPRKVLESCKKTTECETVAEKSLDDVVGADDRSQDEGVLVSSRDDQIAEREVDSEANNLKREMEEDDVERESINNEVVLVDDWKERRLRRVVSEGDVDLNEKEKERLRLIVISKNKVKALVSTFENLIT